MLLKPVCSYFFSGEFDAALFHPTTLWWPCLSFLLSLISLIFQWFSLSVSEIHLVIRFTTFLNLMVHSRVKICEQQHNLWSVHTTFMVFYGTAMVTMNFYCTFFVRIFQIKIKFWLYRIKEVNKSFEIRKDMRCKKRQFLFWVKRLWIPCALAYGSIKTGCSSSNTAGFS